MKGHYTIIFLFSVIVFAACVNRDYEAGDGKYSHLLAEMTDITVKGSVIQSIVTDEGETLKISSGQSIEVTPSDTILRWMLYYNKTDDATPVTLVGKKNVSIVNPVDKKELLRRNPSFEMKTDTLKVTSVWMAKNNKYLNMNLGLWMGNTTSEDDTQSLFLIRDAVSTKGKGKVSYSLYHDQADVPVGYYTQEVYLSVPTTAQDTIDVCIGHTHYVEVKKE